MQPQLLQSITAASIDAIVCAEEQGRITLWNPAAGTLFGYTAAEVLGQPLTMLMREQDRAAHLAGISHFLKIGGGSLVGKVTEVQGLRKNGSTFTQEMSLSAEKVEGEWLFTAIMRDISERKQAEEALSRKQDQLQSLLEINRKINASLDQTVIRKLLVDAACSLMNTSFGTAGIVEDGRMVFREYRNGGQWIPINYTFEPGFGVPGYVMQTKQPYMTNDAEHDTHVVPKIRAALGFHQIIDVPILTHSGELLGCFEIHDPEHGRQYDNDDVALLEGLAASVAVALDNARLLAERKQQALMLQQSEEKLRQRLEEAERTRKATLFMLEDLNESKDRIELAKREWVQTFDAVTDPIFLHNADGNIMRANRAYAGKAGMVIEDVIGKPYWQVFPKSAKRLHSCEDASLVGEAAEEVTTDDGAVFMMHSYIMEDGDANRHSSVHWMENITERKGYEQKLRQGMEGTIHAVASAVEARDPYTAGHQLRVANLACAIGRKMGLGADRIEGLRMGGMIHDIGKIHLPAEILSKPARLTELEYGLIKEHPQIGYDILKDIDFPWPVADIAYQHHERLDGTGYPQGLSDGKICLEARIMAVADVVEAMSSHRPYRPGLGIGKALAEIKRGRGKQYDTDAVDACIDVVSDKNFSFDA